MTMFAIRCAILAVFAAGATAQNLRGNLSTADKLNETSIKDPSHETAATQAQLESAWMLTNGNRTDDNTMALNSIQLGYPPNYGYNCYNKAKAAATGGNYGYQGQMSVSACGSLCRATSWCVGFQYMTSNCGQYQNKCWLREQGVQCDYSTSGDNACFVYYGYM